MVDLIDAKRDKTDEIYDQPNKVTYQQLFDLYPSLKETKIVKDSILLRKARRNSIRPLINVAMKNATAKIEEDNRSKNELISKNLLV